MTEKACNPPDIWKMYYFAGPLLSKSSRAKFLCITQKTEERV